MKYNGKNIMSVFMKGESAFDIYKKYHPEYTGTEEEWIESLKGTGGTGGAGVEVVQELGYSETAVMSQKAVTDCLNSKADFIYTVGNNLIDESTIIRGSWWTKTGLVSNQYTTVYFACEVDVEGLQNVTCKTYIINGGATNKNPQFYSYFIVYSDGTVSDAVVKQSFLTTNVVEIPTNATKLRINYNCAHADWILMINEGTEELPYEPYYRKQTIPIVEEKLNEFRIEQVASIEARNPKFVIGTSLTAVVGDTIQVFYKSIIDGDIGEFDIMFKCSKGKNYPRYWEYTPTASDVGSYPITMALYAIDGSIIDEASCTLKVVAAVNPTKTVNILCVGDSTMEAGQIPIEASRRFKNTTGVATTPNALNLSNINFVGRKTNADKTVGWEGTGGWSYGSYIISGYTAVRFTVTNATDLNIGAVYQVGNFKLQIAEINVTNGTGNVRCLFYYTTPYSSAFDSTVQSGTLTRTNGNGQDTLTYSAWVKETYQPFWDVENNSFDILGYRDMHCNGKIDVICVLLGINNIISMDAFSTKFTGLNDAKSLFRNIHTQLPDCKIIASTLPPISPNGGIAANYGASSKMGAYSQGVSQHNAQEFNRRLIELGEEEEFASYVTISNTHAQFDSENAYPTITKPLNTRTTQTEKLQSNGVHPANEGYWQLADALAFRTVLGVI